MARNTPDEPTDDHPLKVTSPRLEKEEFTTTPSGARELDPNSRDARDLDPESYTSGSRARGEWADPSHPGETDETTLEGFGGGPE